MNPTDPDHKTTGSDEEIARDAAKEMRTANVNGTYTVRSDFILTSGKTIIETIILSAIRKAKEQDSNEDTKRLDWLDKNLTSGPCVFRGTKFSVIDKHDFDAPDWPDHHHYGDTLREAIDAAMKEQK